MCDVLASSRGHSAKHFKLTNTGSQSHTTYCPEMEMDDELENFIRERKARVAEDKACLQQDPPYMEMKAKPYRDFGYTVKENIPPKSKAEEKEESCSIGLPLGVAYERKKQKLQQELRMDYRRYMAQTGALYRQKGAANPTRVSRRLHRPLHLAEGGQSSVLPRHRDRLEWPVSQESQEEDRKDELVLKDTSRRRMAVNTGSEKRQFTKTNGRKDSAGVAREGRTSRVRRKSEDAEFITGLLIGAADTREALQRKKERYRQELEEQIAEQYRNKKREKDLELKVPATGINDPEKQPDRLRLFGLNRRNGSQVSQPLPTGDRRSSSTLPDIKKIGAREGEMPPPEQAHVAFQSPLLEYSSALDVGGGGLSPNSQPANPSFSVTSTDNPRYRPFPPCPPPSVSDAYRSPYAEPQLYNGTRNMLGPNTAYYDYKPGSAGLPMPYWNVPPGAAMPSQFGTHGPHSQHNGSSFPPVQFNRPSNERANGASPQLFPSEDFRPAGERKYREALKEQIQEKAERRHREREENKRYQAQLEADMKNYQPWGRGGGGAPLRDSNGNLIADLNQMHKQNEKAYINPEQQRRRATADMAACRTEHVDPTNCDSDDYKPGSAGLPMPYWNVPPGAAMPSQFGTHSPHSQHNGSSFPPVQFNRPSNERANGASPQLFPSEDFRLARQMRYREALKQQIEENARKKAEEKERIRLEEEKEEKRLAEQRACLQREYEEQQERNKQKEMEKMPKNEAQVQLAAKSWKAAERKEEEAEKREKAERRRRYERERQARIEEVNRVPSPPIPTLQKRSGQQQHNPRPPTGDSQLSTVPLSERSLSGLQSPPIPACRNQLQAAGDPDHQSSELSALRWQLHSEMKRLKETDEEHLDSCLSSSLFRNRGRPQSDVFDLARRNVRAPVRRASSRNTEPQNSLQPKYRDYLDLSPPQQNDHLRCETRASTRGSLLESESIFLDLLGNGSSVLHTPEPEKTHQLSARERRRLSKQSQHPQERAASSQRDVELGGEWGNTNRTGHLKALSRRGNTAGPLDLPDDESPPPEFSPHSLNRQGSVETVSTDHWMWTRRSDTLKCLDRPLRREQLAT